MRMTRQIRICMSIYVIRHVNIVIRRKCMFYIKLRDRNNVSPNSRDTAAVHSRPCIILQETPFSLPFSTWHRR